MIFAHTCPNCGYTWTPGLIQVAQVINVYCLDCQCNIRYCTIEELPDLENIKTATWEAASGDMELINAAKRSMLFTPSQLDEFSQVKYLRLYNAVFFLKNIKKKFERITPRITFV
jgi:predicted  nucleic acid-binding Zn-ribbon protein